MNKICKHCADFFAMWEHWWCRKDYPHIIAIVRIAMGAWLFFYWIIRLPHIDILFSDRGLVFPDTPDYLPASLLFLFEVPTLQTVTIVYWTLLCALILLTIGLWSRMAALVSFLAYAYFYYLSLHLFHTSYDRLFMFSLLVLSFAQSDETFSFAAWERHGSFFAWKNMISILPQRFLAIQITFTYLGVGWQKLWLPGWQGGEMLWYSMIGVWGTPLAFKITALGWSPAYHVVVNIIKLFECWWPFGLWIRWKGVRWWTFLGGLIFHIVVDMLLYIWWFIILIPAYIIYFSPDEVYAFLKKHDTMRIRRFGEKK